MDIKKININKILIIFLFSHLTIWTLVPSISNENLPLDTIEALAWASNLDWGFNKHPPMSALAVEIFYRIFGNKDWAYYFLSQIFVIISFFVVWKFSEFFLRNKTQSLIALLLLEGIFFYNYTTPEFNVYVCELPFWTLTVLFCWRGFKDNKTNDWLMFGFFAALGVLSHYLFIYLLAAIDVFFLYMIYKKKINFKCLISLIPFFIILLPHTLWLIENDYTTITYGMHRTGTGDQNFIDHLTHPIIFLLKQIGILLPFFLLFFLTISKLKLKFNINDKKLLFLLTINIIPIILIFLTSMIAGIKIRTMWMTPFYLFFGILAIYIFQINMQVKKIKNFLIGFLILFILSPITYLYVSISQTNKRTDYPGKEIAIKVQESWDSKFNNKITYVSGDEWTAGNLSYHLKSRPKWIGINKDMKSKNKLSIVDVFENNISEAVSKIGYFRVYGE